MIERVLQKIPRPKEFVLYRSERELLHRSNLLVRKLREMAELDELPVIGRQLFHRLVDGGGELLVLQGPLRRDAVIGDLAVFLGGRIVVEWAGQGDFGDALLPQRVDRAVLGDPEEPG